MGDEDRLRQAGLRVTAARVAIMQTVREGDHLDVEAVYRACAIGSVRSPFRPSMTPCTRCTEEGCSAGSNPWAAPPDMRRESVTTITISSAAGAARSPTSTARSARPPASIPSHDAGYLVDEADVIFWGICPGCRSQDAEDSR